ncbi:MAG TPA: biotin/lipoyl-binding protein [Ignavibacteria bacterium]|nr:biotin/lipoyl-binding protein [Ignavibacteria bacterium]
MSEYIVTIEDIKNEIIIFNGSSVKLNGKRYDYDVTLLSGVTYLLTFSNKLYKISSEKINDEKYRITVDGKQFEAVIRTSLQEKASKLVGINKNINHKLDVKAPMPGIILKIKKNEGDEISKGESIMILEAMKMENDLCAPISGTIRNLNVQEGIAVEKGVDLFSIE